MGLKTSPTELIQSVSPFEVYQPASIVQIISKEDVDFHWHWFYNTLAKYPHLDGKYVMTYRKHLYPTVDTFWYVDGEYHLLHEYMYVEGSRLELEEGKEKHSSLFI